MKAWGVVTVTFADKLIDIILKMNQGCYRRWRRTFKVLTYVTSNIFFICLFMVLFCYVLTIWLDVIKANSERWTI